MRTKRKTTGTKPVAYNRSFAVLVIMIQNKIFKRLIDAFKESQACIIF